MSEFTIGGGREALSVIDQLGAGQIVLPSQVPGVTNWTPEKRLAGAVLSQALAEIRDHSGDRAHRRRVQEDLEWVRSDEAEHPYSFVRLCELFGLEPEWVRRIVRQWNENPRILKGRQVPPYRQAA